MKEKSISIGRLDGLDLSASASALLFFILLWVLLSAAAFWILRLPLLNSVLAGVVCTLIHYASETWHQLGHAWSARRTGYPMNGIRFWGLLASSLYPASEGSLPAAIHIRRALGGPAASLALAILAILPTLVFRSSHRTLEWISIFLLADNLLVFTLGSLTPLGFTDGSTLLEWSRKK